MIEGDFGVAISLFHAYHLLYQHGARSFLHALKNIMNNDPQYVPKISRSKAELIKNPEFLALVDFLETKTRDRSFRSHEKLNRLEAIVIRHFQEHQQEDTRIMIFSQYRDSVSEIVDILSYHREVRVMSFIGQSSAGGTKGFSQKKQLEVIRQFREGNYNTLVATSIGEEGLDIGEIDLILCFDAQFSIVRTLQRIGRTGRNRQGRIIMLLTEGKEEHIYRKNQAAYKNVQKSMISEVTRATLYRDNPRMLPLNCRPVLRKMILNPIISQTEISKGPNDYDDHYVQGISKPSCYRLLLPKPCPGPYLSEDEWQEWKYRYKLDLTATDKPSVVLHLNSWIEHQVIPSEIYRVPHSKRTLQFIHFLSRSYQRFQIAYPRTSSDISKNKLPDVSLVSNDQNPRWISKNNSLNKNRSNVYRKHYSNMNQPIVVIEEEEEEEEEEKKEDAAIKLRGPITRDTEHSIITSIRMNSTHASSEAFKELLSDVPWHHDLEHSDGSDFVDEPQATRRNMIEILSSYEFDVEEEPIDEAWMDTINYLMPIKNLSTDVKTVSESNTSYIPLVRNYTCQDSSKDNVESSSDSTIHDLSYHPTLEHPAITKSLIDPSTSCPFYSSDPVDKKMFDSLEHPEEDILIRRGGFRRRRTNLVLTSQEEPVLSTMVLKKEDTTEHIGSYQNSPKTSSSTTGSERRNTFKIRRKNHFIDDEASLEDGDKEEEEEEEEEEEDQITSSMDGFIVSDDFPATSSSKLITSSAKSSSPTDPMTFYRQSLLSPSNHIFPSRLNRNGNRFKLVFRSKTPSSFTSDDDVDRSSLLCHSTDAFDGKEIEAIDDTEDEKEQNPKTDFYTRKMKQPNLSESHPNFIIDEDVDYNNDDSSSFMKPSHHSALSHTMLPSLTTRSPLKDTVTFPKRLCLSRSRTKTTT
jgi:hypothetical protein